jgi:hypothetical protein
LPTNRLAVTNIKRLRIKGPKQEALPERKGRAFPFVVSEAF